MRAIQAEPDLLVLRRLAEELAHSRKERTTSGHLLAAIVSHPSQAAELLLERKLGPDILLKAARATTDEEPDPLARAVQRARELAARMGTSGPSAIHLLLALIHDRKNGAHRALAQCGVDVARLRAAAMQLALGRIGPRRPHTDDQESQKRTTPLPRATASTVGQSSAVRIPILPPPLGAPSKAAMPTPLPPAPKAGVVIPLSRFHSAPALGSAAEPIPALPNRGSANRKRGRAPSSDSRFALDPKHFPTLAAMGRNLTLAAAEGALDPVVGRAVEIDQALDVLAKRHANNPLLVGHAGVGKTSVVHGIALRIAKRDEVSSLDDRIIIEVPISELLAGTHARGSLAERVTAIRNEVREGMGRVVLFFDEIHTLFTREAAEEVHGELKIALARGELPCIGTTTQEEYRRAIESDAALARRFAVVEVEEPAEDVAREILAGCVPAFAKHHGVTYAEEALTSTVGWCVRYLPGRALPDKALSVLDLAGARARRRALRTVDPQGIAEVIAELTDMPVERLMESDGQRMLALETLLAERVVGHAPALHRMATILRRNAAGFRSKRPIGTFLLLGPTGVGKTESAKAIAHALFRSETAMTRLDMAEYAEPHAVARLIGAPPGYIGHDAGGQLTEAVRRRPYQVILLDEIEKAHRDVLESFLGVFDEGRLTDGRGRTIDFTNTVIILTSNLGAEEVSAAGNRSIGFGKAESAAASIEAALVGAARAALPPELYNRIDEVIAFAPLKRSEVAEIARRILGALGKTLEAARGVLLDIDDDAVERLLSAGGYDPELGARPMKRTVARLVEAPIADMILRGELAAGDVARVTVEQGEIVIDVVKKQGSFAVR
ncbi:MAG TPA: ATP-dependent Clp protease ATP-binding subunit [Polyangiaceae bacterium]|nr:ATP-dependent Clp protease ATP-binding subunit [Polyangiaceae bacterium]